MSPVRREPLIYGCAFQAAFVGALVVLGYWTDWTVAVGAYSLYLILDVARYALRKARDRTRPRGVA